MTIHDNSRSDFVFAQMNAAYCIGEQNKKDTSTFPQFLVEMGLQDEMRTYYSSLALFLKIGCAF